MSDWMKVMLEEIADKQAAQQAAREEHERRRAGGDDEPHGHRADGSARGDDSATS